MHVIRPEIQKWIDQAERELRAARALLEASEPSICVFHCQQAIEMGLKAVLMMLLEMEPPHVHSLVRLGELTNCLHEFEPLFRELTPAYTDARYPGASEESPDEIYGGERSWRIFEQTTEFFEWLRTEITRLSKNS